MLQNSLSLVTLLTIKLQRVCKKLFKRIFITWYFKNVINRSIDRFFWGNQNLSKKGILYLYLYLSLRWNFYYGSDNFYQTTFISVTWNFSFFLSFWTFFSSNFCIFTQNSMLVNKLTFNELLVFYSAAYQNISSQIGISQGFCIAKLGLVLRRSTIVHYTSKRMLLLMQNFS